jgi:hypothetical protein
MTTTSEFPVTLQSVRFEIGQSIKINKQPRGSNRFGLDMSAFGALSRGPRPWKQRATEQNPVTAIPNAKPIRPHPMARKTRGNKVKTAQQMRKLLAFKPRHSHFAGKWLILCNPVFLIVTFLGFASKLFATFLG